MMVTIVRVPTRLTLRSARILSVIGPGGLMLAAVAGAMFRGPDGRVQTIFHVLGLVFMLLSLVLFIDGRSQPTNVAEKFDPLFDERERSERDRAFRNSHKIVVSGIMLVCQYVSLAIGWDFWLPNLRGAVDVALACGFVALGLPGMILIWRERPVTNDE
jgi:hypothetical protein